jgi:hypothetical protein
MARNKDRADDPLRGGSLHVPRSRGAVSGIVLIILGAFGILAPLIGPWFSFGLSPNKSWQFTNARLWLEFLPGAVTVLGGLLLLLAANRIAASFGAWLGVAGGAWYIVGTTLAPRLGIHGSPGTPLHSSKWLQAIESLALFTGLGAIILFVSAAAVGRLSVRSVRDVRAAQRREAQAAEAEEEKRRAQVALEEQQRRDSAYEEQLRREGAEKERERLTAEREQEDKSARERGDNESRVRQDQQRIDAEHFSAREQAAQQQQGRQQPARQQYPADQQYPAQQQAPRPVVGQPQYPTQPGGGATAQPPSN